MEVKSFNAPSLGTVNGIGTKLYPSVFGQNEISIVWLCLIYIPLIPLGMYAVSYVGEDEDGKSVYRFQNKICFLDAIKFFGMNRFIILLGTGVMQGLIIALTFLGVCMIIGGLKWCFKVGLYSLFRS